MRAIAIMMTLAIPLGACGHREKKAPCSPADGVPSQQPLAYAPLVPVPISPFGGSTDCGPLKLMNTLDLGELPQALRIRP